MEIDKAIDILHALKTHFDSCIDDALTGEPMALEALESNTDCGGALKLAITALEREKEPEPREMCWYCRGLIHLTKASPRRKYKYCPMCGRSLKERDKS